jgi:molecular chaperone DnaK (HSP70)
MFCFSYPAQRQELEPLFKELIIESGFPEDHLCFLDEPTSAAYCSFIGNVSSSQAVMEHGLGLIIDIGAGTTDFTLANFQGGRSFQDDRSINIIDSSSANIAGNDFTRALSRLLKNNSQDAFARFMVKSPWGADRIKEAFSDHYSDPDNYDVPIFRARAGVGRFESQSLDHFQTAIQSEWNSLMACVLQRLRAANHTERDLKFVLLTGGGALHSGLVKYVREQFGDKAVILSKEPQTVVAQGACQFAKNICLPDQVSGLTVSMAVPRVWIEFPPSTNQKDVVIFESNQEIPTAKSLSGRASIVLQSNIFFSEGDLHLRVDEETINLGSIDIQWFLTPRAAGESPEWNDHKGVVEWDYKPTTGSLSVVVKLVRTYLSDGKFSVVGQIELPVKMRGQFFCARLDDVQNVSHN